MPKFSLHINGDAVGEITAANAHDAVDAAREAHQPPEEGGHFDIEVRCDEPWVDTAGKTQPAGVVSSFSVRHEPAPHLREGIEAAEREAEAAAVKAAEREQIRAEVLAELEAELAAAKGESK